ncbi:MAG: hypothetical protein ACPLRW_04765 [Moorellales bacterium]
MSICAEAVLCTARNAEAVVRRGGIAVVSSRYGARREGLLVKVLCRDEERLSAWLDGLSVAGRLCTCGSVPHLDLTGAEARRLLEKIGAGGLQCVRESATGGS